MTAAPDESNIVPLHKTPLTVAPPPPSGARAAVARLADRPLPTPGQLGASARWWTTAFARLVPRVPLLLVKELWPITVGLGRVLRGWSRWVACAELAAQVKQAEGNQASKDGIWLEKRKSARLIVSLVVAAATIGVGVWLWLAQPMWGAAVAIAVLVVLDAVGRSGKEAAPKQVLLPTGPIVEGIPLSTLRAEIVQSFELMGIEATIGMPFPVDHGWTVDYHTRAAIEDDHMRQLERDLNIRRNGITQIMEKGQAARGVLHVMLRDPLAEVVLSPDPGDLSIYAPLPLGVTASGEVWNEHFLRTHFATIGASQSGKSSCFWQVIDVLRRCPEVELDGIDLTNGPVFGATRRAMRRRATDEVSAKKVLQEAVALCKKRNAELNRLSEADDTPDDFEEKWQPTAEDPQRVILIDEFARLAEDEELLGFVEYILRYGAKAAVVIGLAGQGGGVGDFGKSIIRAQVMLKILFACARMDVLSIFGKDARDIGYRPDLLEPANGEEINDAGKCFVMSARSKTPEMRRAYRLEQAEVRRRDRERGFRDRHAEALDAVEVPLVLDLLERLIAGRDFLPTQEVLDHDDCEWPTAKGLANALVPFRIAPDQHRQTKVRGYWAADIHRAIREL